MVRERYDAVVVGGSLAGCAAAIMLGRQGARVALVERRPDPAAYKRVCSHFIQASAVPTVERLGLLEPILDPLLRRTAAATPGVAAKLGWTATRLLRDGERWAGAAVVDRDGNEVELVAPLVVGADGRDSGVARLAGLRERVLPHERFVYGGYFAGAMPEGAPDATIWMADPQFMAAFPTDGELVFYAAMPTKDRLPEFKRDPERALVAFVSDFPEPPPIRESRLVGEVIGKLEMPNRVRQLTAPGLAMIGDAALASDPLFGIGCGWALQSAEWLADAAGPALRGRGSLARGLDRYRRRHHRRLRGHAFFIHDYSTARRFNPAERLIFSASARDPRLAVGFDRYGTRQIGPARMVATMLPRALALETRRALAGGRG